MTKDVISYGDMFAGPFVGVWQQFSAGFFLVIVAIILFVVGLVVASLLSQAARKIVEQLKIDTLTTRVHMLRKAQDAGWKIKPSYLVGWIVKWFIIIVTLLTVSEYLGLNAVAKFLGDIVAFIPQVVVAIVLLVIGFIVAQFAHDVTKQSVTSSQMSAEAQKIIPLIAKWSIIVFAGLTAANQLGIGDTLINTFWTGVVFALALALGLSFGLGGKEHAARLLDRFDQR